MVAAASGTYSCSLIHCRFLDGGYLPPAPFRGIESCRRYLAYPSFPLSERQVGACLDWTRRGDVTSDKRKGFQVKYRLFPLPASFPHPSGSFALEILGSALLIFGFGGQPAQVQGRFFFSSSKIPSRFLLCTRPPTILYHAIPLSLWEQRLVFLSSGLLLPLSIS